MIITQLREELRTWLYRRSFPDHRSVPPLASLRRSGYALPGFDTPAAGWLLPVITELTTERDGVTIDRRRYIDRASGIEPGLHVRIHAAPTHVPLARGIFVEYVSGQPIHYLALQPTSKEEM